MRVPQCFAFYLCYIYNGIGRLTKAIDPEGNEASMSMTQWRTDNKHNKHNSMNQLTRRIEAGKGYYTYGYDRRGSQVKEVCSKKFSVVHKDYVLDYTSPLTNVITYNSNSFTSGLQSASGITPVEPTLNVPGWENPLPTSVFRHI